MKVIFKDILYNDMPQEYFITQNHHDDYRNEEDVRIVEINTNSICIDFLNTREELIALLDDTEKELRSFIKDECRVNWDFDFNISSETEGDEFYPFKSVFFTFRLYRVFNEDEFEQLNQIEKEEEIKLKEVRYKKFKEVEKQYFEMKNEFEDR